MEDVFHEGQKAVQRITGEEEIAQRRIPTIKTSINQRSLTFIESQILAIPGSEDVDGDIWLSLLVGNRGFIKVPSPQEITFDLNQVISNKEDIFFKNIITKPTVGLLFHEAVRRARYRAWGQASHNDDQIKVDIKMGYPSCPKHIQRVVLEVPEETPALKATYQNGTTLGDEEKKWMTSAHTFFIGTQTKKGDIEASHRGGDPGFVEIIENDILRIPDYLGNSMYSTLGNIYENPKASLLFVDYEKGETLQLTGTAELQFDQMSDEDFYKSGETGRFFIFKTKRWIRTVNHHKINSEFVDYSRFNILTKRPEDG